MPMPTPMPRRKTAIHKLRKACALLLSRKLIPQKLFLFKRNNKYKLFRHYNYSYIGEYQFSPSTTPLISHHHNHHRTTALSKKRTSRILHLICGGAPLASMIETTLDFGELEPSPLPILNKEPQETIVVEDMERKGWDNAVENGYQWEREGEEDDDSSVDKRAQRFIDRFYEEIRLERQHSFVQWKEMLQRSC